MMAKKLKIICALSILPQYFLVKVLKQQPEFMETYYSNGLFPLISKLLNTAFKWIPFSVGDVLYAIVIVYSIRWIVLNRKRLRTQPKVWGIECFSFFVRTLFYVSLVLGLQLLSSALTYDPPVKSRLYHGSIKKCDRSTGHENECSASNDYSRFNVKNNDSLSFF